MITYNLVVLFLEPFKPLSFEIQPTSSLWVEGKLDLSCAWVHSFMDTKVANLETQDALLFHRASAALDFVATCGYVVTLVLELATMLSS